MSARRCTLHDQNTAVEQVLHSPLTGTSHFRVIERLLLLLSLFEHNKRRNAAADRRTQAQHANHCASNGAAIRALPEEKKNHGETLERRRSAGQLTDDGHASPVGTNSESSGHPSDFDTHTSLSHQAPVSNACEQRPFCAARVPYIACPTLDTTHNWPSHCIRPIGTRRIGLRPTRPKQRV